MNEVKKESNFRFCVEIDQDGEILKVENYPIDGLNLATEVFIPFFRYAKKYRPELIASIISAKNYVDNEE